MTTLDSDSIAGLLEATGTELGGRAYGLEPLVLPSGLGHGDGGRDRDGDVEVTEWYRNLLHAATSGEPSRASGVPDSAEQLFWFRWITGHQVVFVLWQELGRRAAEATGGPETAGEVAAAARLLRGYSAMLLYTASCTRDVYHRVIRPSMALHHPGFSGAWGRDYPPVRGLLRGRVPDAWDGRADVLLRESVRNETVHEVVAAKLVPDAPSLLQSATGGVRALPRDVRAVLFDTYFLTLRAPSSPSEVAAQLSRRVRAVREDLGTNGLYPGFASSRHERPDVPADVEAIEREIPRLLSDITRDAVRRRAPSPMSSDRGKEPHGP